QFAEYINSYGPIILLRVGHSKVKVITGRHQVRQNRRGGLPANRPRMVAAGEILSCGLRITLALTGEHFWRLGKLAVHTHFWGKVVDSYAPIQTDTTRDVILDILENHQGHQAAANRYAASVILRVTYRKSTPTT
ncbi:uncharacterized protein F5147DRAFT_551663, partial [Suillus discolor]